MPLSTDTPAPVRIVVLPMPSRRNVLRTSRCPSSVRVGAGGCSVPERVGTRIGMLRQGADESDEGVALEQLMDHG